MERPNFDEQPGSKRKRQASKEVIEEDDSEFEEDKENEEVIKEGRPTDYELHQLANVISGSWKALGRELKIDEAKLNQFESDGMLDTYEQAYQMLWHWKESNAAAATYRNLHNALTALGYNSLAKKYCERPRKKELTNDYLSMRVYVMLTGNMGAVILRIGTPRDYELHKLATEATTIWKKLGRELFVKESIIDQIRNDNGSVPNTYEQGIQMLKHWKESNAEAATYRNLFNALTEVGYSTLAKKYCIKKK